MGQKFYELEIWKSGHDLLINIYKVTRKYPSEEKFALTSDTRRSANSIIANIAESHGRYYFADKTRVLYIARGEIEEVQSHLYVAKGLNYIIKEEFDKLINSYEGLKIGLNNYIQSIINQKNNFNPSSY